MRRSCRGPTKLLFLAGDFNLLSRRLEISGGWRVQRLGRLGLGRGGRDSAFGHARVTTAKVDVPAIPGGSPIRCLPHRPDVCLLLASGVAEFVATASARGDMFDRAFRSDFLPVMASADLAKPRDPRLAPPIDQRVFESPAFVELLERRCMIRERATVTAAQHQLCALKLCVRDLSRAPVLALLDWRCDSSRPGAIGSSCVACVARWSGG